MKSHARNKLLFEHLYSNTIHFNESSLRLTLRSRNGKDGFWNLLTKYSYE